MSHWNPKKRILLENPGVVRDIAGIQKAMSETLNRGVTLEVVIDYLLQSYRHANEKEASLEFAGFTPRPQKVFQDERAFPVRRPPEESYFD